MNGTVTTALITIVSSLILAYATARLQIYHAKADLQKEMDSRFNERRWEVYIAFADLIRQLWLTSQVTNERDKARAMATIYKQLHEISNKLWIIGSDDVIKAVAEWMRYLRSSNAGGVDTFVLLNDIILAMRRDLGNRNTDVTYQDMFTAIINNIDTVFAENKEQISAE